MKIQASYDDVSDVLYITAKNARSTTKIENVAGLVLRYDSDSRKPVGATVVDYKEYWMPKGHDLSRRLAQFFHVTPATAERVLKSAL